MIPAHLLPFRVHWFLLLPVWLLAESRAANAQTYAVGDQVTVIHWDAEIKRSSNIVGTADVGDSFEVGQVEGNWLWIESRQGYLNVADVVPYDQAIEHFTAMIRRDPQSSSAYHDRAWAWNARGEHDIAIGDFTEAIRLGGQAPSYIGRGRAWYDKGDLDRAIADYNEAIRLDPNDAWALNSLAWLLATGPEDGVRNGERAVELATAACELTDWKASNHLDTLAAAYAEAGEFSEAVEWQTKALEFARADEGNEDVSDLEARLELYQAGMPYREPSPTVEQSAAQ